MAYNPLQVSLDNIIPLTEARDHFSQIVNEVQSDKLYVLTKGGKPAVAIIDVKYLERITGGEINEDHVEKEIQKNPAKVGRTSMIEHNSPTFNPKPVTSPPPFKPEPPKPIEPKPAGLEPSAGQKSSGLTSGRQPFVAQKAPEPPKPTIPEPKPYETPKPNPEPPKPPMPEPKPYESPKPNPEPFKPSTPVPSTTPTPATDSNTNALKTPPITPTSKTPDTGATNIPINSPKKEEPKPTTVDITTNDFDAGVVPSNLNSQDDTVGPAQYSGSSSAPASHSSSDDMVID